jgi:transposase-like protein
MRCEQCQRYFTPVRKPQGHDPTLREQALKLCLEGMSFRGIGRQLGVHHQSVANWLNAHHEEQLPEKVEDQTPTETVEVDELFTFVGKKSAKRT